jgi:alcohol dehydrogenase, propanol-preferring
MSTTMKAAVVRAFGKPLVIEDVPVPVPGPGEILVKTRACGVCHTDLHAASGDWPVKPVPPFIPGHEVAGVVAALGPGVTDLKLGDAVGVAWLHDACLACEYCETGWETLCEHQHNTGYSVNGGFAESVIASAAFAARLPASVDFAAIAPVLCAGVTTYKGLKETDSRPGEWVAISGVGGLGHIAIQYAKAMGFKVIGLDLAEDKLALAKEAGADHAINVLSPHAVKDVLDATGGGAHGILVTAVSTSAFAQALKMVRRKGTSVSWACRPANSRPRSSTSCSSASPCAARSSAHGATSTRRLRLRPRGKVRAEITKAPLGDINVIFDRMKSGKIDGRMVLDFG